MMFAKENVLMIITALKEILEYRLASYFKNDLIIIDINNEINYRKVNRITFEYNTVKQTQTK